MNDYETQRYEFVVTLSTRGGLFIASLTDDYDIAHGETPMRAIRNLAQYLDEQDVSELSRDDVSGVSQSVADLSQEVETTPRPHLSPTEQVVWDYLESNRDAVSMTVRQVETETGVSRSTVSRVRRKWLETRSETLRHNGGINAQP